MLRGSSFTTYGKESRLLLETSDTHEAKFEIGAEQITANE
jgi:hypothetical protein